MTRSNTEIISMLKTIRNDIGSKLQQADTWYGKNTTAYHAYKKCFIDCLCIINDKIESLKEEIINEKETP